MIMKHSSMNSQTPAKCPLMCMLASREEYRNCPDEYSVPCEYPLLLNVTMVKDPATTRKTRLVVRRSSRSSEPL